MSSCVECDRAGIDHDAFVRQCLSSPLEAGRILGRFDWFSNPLHKAIDEWHMKKINEGCRRLLILLPRGHMKTFYFGISTILWRTLLNREERILYVMSSCSESAKTLASLRDIYMTSEGIKHFFPKHVLDLSKSNVKVRSTQDYLRLLRDGNYREGTVEARGIDSRITGGHFTHHIFDDLIDEKMVDSDVLQEDAINFIKRAEPMFVNAGEDTRTIIGTRWPGTFYNWLLEPGGIADSYEKLILGCYVDDRFHRFLADIGKKTLLPDGAPIWERFTEATLEDIRKVSHFDFAHQYLNIEVSDKDRRFKKDDIVYFNFGVTSGKDSVLYQVDGKTKWTAVDSLYRTMTVDPATGEGKNTDESAITVCGLDHKTGLIFVLDAWDGRVLPFDLIDKIFEMVEKWHPHLVAPEDVSFQKSLKWFIKRQQAERGIHFPIRPVRPGSKRKGSRIIDALQPFVQNQQVHFQKSQRKLINEMLNMQIIKGAVIGKSPNLLDSLAYHSEFWRAGPTAAAGFGDDIDDVNQYVPDAVPAYGLCCLT